jgi:hypothetical protein
MCSLAGNPDDQPPPTRPSFIFSQTGKLKSCTYLQLSICVYCVRTQVATRYVRVARSTLLYFMTNLLDDNSTLCYVALSCFVKDLCNV